MHLMVSFLTGLELMTMITLMVITMMMAVTLWLMKGMKQMAERQKIVTSAGWLDQCQDGPPSMEFAEIEAEKLPPSQWDVAAQEKCQQVLAERNKSLPAQSKNQSGKDPNQNDVRIVDRSYLQKSFKAQSETAQKLIVF